MTQEINLLKARLCKVEGTNIDLIKRMDDLTPSKPKQWTRPPLENAGSNYETNQLNTKAMKPQSSGTNAILKSKLYNQQLEGKQPKVAAMAKFTN